MMRMTLRPTHDGAAMALRRVRRPPVVIVRRRRGDAAAAEVA